MLQLLLCFHLPQERKKTNIIVWVNDRINNCLQCIIMNLYHWYYQSDGWVYFCIDRSTSIFMIITVGIIYESQTWVPTWLPDACQFFLRGTWARSSHPALASKHNHLTDLIWRQVALLLKLSVSEPRKLGALSIRSYLFLELLRLWLRLIWC